MSLGDTGEGVRGYMAAEERHRNVARKARAEVSWLRYELEQAIDELLACEECTGVQAKHWHEVKVRLSDDRFEEE